MIVTSEGACMLHAARYSRIQVATVALFHHAMAEPMNSPNLKLAANL